MKKGFLRIVAVIMVVLMTAVYMPVAEISDIFATKASALITSDVSLGGNVKWKYDSGSETITVYGSGSMKNFSNGDNGQRWDEIYKATAKRPKRNATKIVIENGVTNIGNNVFNGLSKVTTVVIPASVTSIGTSAFEGCTALSSVTLPSKLKTIGSNAFKNTKFTNVKIPDSVTSIGSGAFSGISGVKVTCNYGSYAYDYCMKNSINCAIPANMLYIDSTFDSEAKQVTVAMKILYNKAKLNAANFTLTYNNAVVSILGDPIYESANGVVKAVAFSEGKISVAVIAEDYVPYSSKSVCEYNLGTYTFSINGHADKVDFKLACDTLLINEAKASLSSVTSSEELHIFTEKVTTEPS